MNMPIINSLLSLSPEAIAARILIAAFILPFHELAHGWMANKLGDSTAKWMGRLTLNPIKHLDPIGSVLLIFTGYGWANRFRLIRVTLKIKSREWRLPRRQDR